ncbi:MAG TPA: hypothetical protein VG722_02490 [Tepidisphaeraceae bacterium]|nr:hypothetical protein [Tepidisphaeraceae bacterium]
MGNQYVPTLRQEAELIERFARGYRAKFAHLIDQLNGPSDKISDMQCLRLCVEAVDIMLDNQCRLADAVRRLSSEHSPMKSAA